MAEAELKTLGRYNIERTLGKGAMGVVYEGLDPKLNRRVAIKTILKSHLDPDTAKDYSMRFSREAQAVARLNHPHIVQVYDFAEEGDIAYLVMEFIRGKELKNFFDANERFDIREVVRIMCELLDALEFAHNAGIIHRDIKPANVMLDAQARTKLTDFGVARVQDVDRTHAERTQAGTMVGTPAYMSPEQITGSNIDKRTDVFSAGIILYQFLTGEKPFTGGGAWTIAKKIIQEDPPLPSSLNNAVTPYFDAVVNKALSKNPETRYPSAKDFGVALKRALQGQGEEDDSDRTVVGEMSIPPAARSAPPPRPAAAAGGTGTQTSTQVGNQEVELEFWRAIKDGNDPDDFELYVQQFPTGIYAALAKRKISKLRGATPEETTAEANKQERKEAEEAVRREADARAKLAAEKEKLELELAKKEEEFQKREAQREAEAQARAAAQEQAEKARLEAIERAKQEAAAELAKREAEYKKREAEAEAKRQAEAKARAEAEAKAKAEADAKAKQELAAERERARQEAENAKQEAEKARRDAEEKIKKENEALVKKQTEERAKREAEFKKREAELKAQAAAGGKKTSPAVLVGIPAVIIAIAGAGWYFFAPDDAVQKARIAAMQKQLEEAKLQAEAAEKAKKSAEDARVALEKARKAEDDARKSGDAKQKQLAEDARARAEAEAKKTADASRLRDAEAKKTADAAKAVQDKASSEERAKAKLAQEKAEKDRAAAEKAQAAKLAADKAAAEKAVADARAAAEKAKADADKAIADARAAEAKAKADAEKAKREASQTTVAAAPASDTLFEQASALEQQGKGGDAVKAYTRAARAGNSKAMKRLGEIYDKGIPGVSRDYAESLKWYNAARVLGEEVPLAKGR